MPNQFQANFIDSIALRKAKIVYNFGLCECNRFKKPNLLNIAYKKWAVEVSDCWFNISQCNDCACVYCLPRKSAKLKYWQNDKPIFNLACWNPQI